MQLHNIIINVYSLIWLVLGRISLLMEVQLAGSRETDSLVPGPFEGGKGLGTTACACAKDTVYFPYNAPYNI